MGAIVGEASTQAEAAPRDAQDRRRRVRRRGWALVAVLALVALVLALTRPWVHTAAEAPLPVLPAVPAEPLAGVVSGVYCGGRDVTCVKSFEEWRGGSLGIVGGFLPQATWADIQAPDWWTAIWQGTPYQAHLLITVPMLPDLKWTNLQEGAKGTYDVYFKQTARNLVAAGLGNSWIRIGPELNGTWFRWSAQPDPAAYVEYYRHIVTAMRSVSGGSFTFDWNVAVGGDLHMDATKAYPGDAYVDAIGQDVYDQKWNDAKASPEERWAQLVSPSGATAQGLEFWADFGKTHGKPLSYGEWGLVGKDSPMAKGGGGGDDPSFIDHMHQWFGTHDTAFEVYFDRDPPDGTHQIDGGEFPLAAERYQQLF